LHLLKFFFSLLHAAVLIVLCVDQVLLILLVLEALLRLLRFVRSDVGVHGGQLRLLRGGLGCWSSCLPASDVIIANDKQGVRVPWWE